VTIEQRGDSEVVVCYDRASGKERWAHSYPAAFRHSEPMGGDGPRATPTIAAGDVFSLGALGDLVCLEGTNGKPRWKVNIIEDCKARVLRWGMSGSPLVLGERVIVCPGINSDSNAGQAVAAYDRKSGKRLWAAGDKPAGYSSPMKATLCGVEQVLLFDARGLAGIDPHDGAELWRRPWLTGMDMNIIQPLVVPGDRVFISSEASNGGALVQVQREGERWSTEVVWQNRALGSKFCNPVYYQGHIYGMSNGWMTCLDARTGERAWRGPQHGHGQILLTGDQMLITTEKLGQLVLAAADPKAYRELGRIDLFGGKTWNTPALAGRHLFVRNHNAMACLELAER
jgi:outer membrane protein assembly factor BamB